MEDANKLRSLAAWYRDFAERTANPWIWEARLHHADTLEHEADLMAADAEPASADH